MRVDCLDATIEVSLFANTADFHPRKVLDLISAVAADLLQDAITAAIAKFRIGLSSVGGDLGCSYSRRSVDSTGGWPQ
jgi:hypothetical protein